MTTAIWVTLVLVLAGCMFYVMELFYTVKEYKRAFYGSSVFVVNYMRMHKARKDKFNTQEKRIFLTNRTNMKESAKDGKYKAITYRAEIVEKQTKVELWICDTESENWVLLYESKNIYMLVSRFRKYFIVVH